MRLHALVPFEKKSAPLKLGHIFVGRQPFLRHVREIERLSVPHKMLFVDFDVDNRGIHSTAPVRSACILASNDNR